MGRRNASDRHRVRSLLPAGHSYLLRLKIGPERHLRHEITRRARWKRGNSLGTPSNQKHWTASVSHDPLGRASKQGRFQAAVSLRTHDNQIAIGGFSRIRYFRVCSADPYQDFNGESVKWAFLLPG